LEPDSDIDSQYMEEEQHSASLDHQIEDTFEFVNKDKGKGIVAHRNNQHGQLSG